MIQIPEISIYEAKKKLDEGQTTFVDIRDVNSYQEAHIPGAIHLHDGNVQEFIETSDKERTLIVYCYHGNSSRGGAAYFLNNDFKEVYSMSGGFEAWKGLYEYEFNK